jgi:hypothetical protein
MKRNELVAHLRTDFCLSVSNIEQTTSRTGRKYCSCDRLTHRSGSRLQHLWSGCIAW